MEPLYRALERDSETELASFEKWLSQQRFAMDGKAYADHAVEAAGSDDGSLYARCYVVARGREFTRS